MSTSPRSGRDSAALGKARRRLLLLAAAAFGGLLGLLAALAIFVVSARRDRPPPLGRSELEAAQRRWRENGPANYDIDVAVTGLRAANYHVEVRDGEPVRAAIDGRPLLDRRTFGTWSVPGMFGTIESDVERAERRAEGRAGPRDPYLSLYASFDPRYGYPARYHRIEWGEAGSDIEVTWKVTALRPK